MAGGKWLAQNKVRPGAYINFESVPAPASNVGTRGIMTMPVELGWGPEKELVRLYSTDLLDGRSLPLIGLSAFDMDSLIFREALSSAYLCLMYRINAGGQKAIGNLGDLKITARYTGKRGNDIMAAIFQNERDNTLLDVVTYLSGRERNRQAVPPSGEGLVDNDYVDFDMPDGATLKASAGKLLSGGDDGVVLPADYADYFDAIEPQIWNTMALPVENPIIKANALTFISNRRDKTGRKSQIVLTGYNNANFEGVISVDQGYINQAGEDVLPTIFTATVAGMTAGAEINESNTFRQLTNAVEIINPIKAQDVEAALLAGKFVLTRRQDGGIVVEQDINTYHRFTPYKDYAFSKNRVIRVLDDIGNQVKTRFENAYIGKVDNNETGRQVFRTDIISYMSELQSIGAIQNFDPDNDVKTKQGMAIDAVVADLWIQPVDSMEKLYMQVYCSSNDAAQTDRGNR